MNLYVNTAVARHLGITAAVLRKWTANWPMLETAVNAQGKNVFTEAQVALLERLKDRLSEEKIAIPLAQMQVEARWRLDQQKEQALPALRELKAFLQDLRDQHFAQQQEQEEA